MANKIKCTCGHSWDKSDSSKKDAMVCHICGKNNMKNGGWLDKFDAPEAQNGIEGTMGGLTDQGFNYNGAWGGPSMQNGGLTFLEPTSRKLPMGHVIPMSDPSTELAISVGGEDGEPAYLIPSFKYGKYLIDKDAKAEFRKTGEHLGGPFKTWQEADEWERTVRHPYVEKGQSIPTPFKRWGKDFAMGGSLPGSVGFTYARTGDIPSNGPYAKKTKASAQNGAEMKFYQEGLDWKPRNISRDGSEIPQAQLGLHMLTPDYSQVGENIMEMLSVPQKALTKLISGKYQAPSEAMGIKNKVGAIATDVILDPINLIGAGAAAKITKASTETGALSKAYKYNPWAFKPNPEAYYRGIGEEGYRDAIGRSFLGNPKGSRFDGNLYMTDDLKHAKLFSKGYIAEIPKAEVTEYVSNPTTRNNPHVFAAENRIPTKNVRLYKEDWLKGYKEVKPPKKKEKGGEITKDDNGYWNPENWGKPVEIGSNNITMQGVYEPLLGISDTGDTQMMYPGKDYKFKGKKVTEYPIAQKGIKTSATPYFKSAKERDAYRQRLKEVSEQALSVGSDEDLLIGTSYHNIDEGNNCINGVCGLNRKAGITYNKPTDVDRFLSGEKFAQAVAKGDEDYYQVDGNFQIGDHMMYRKKKGTASHNKIIYDSFVNDQGEKVYKVIDNAGGKQMKTDNYTESELKKMQLEGGGGYDKVNIYRPGYSIDKTLIEKERLERTSPEARKALADRAERIAWETSNNPGYKYSIRKDSEYYDDQPEGMQKFIEFANDDKKINKLVEKLGVDKGIIHDELLNTFGELGQENKWEDPMFGGNMAPSWLRKLGVKIPIENTIEKIFKPKSWSIGPGQIKFNNIDPELKKKFNIEKPRDLYDFEKIIPLMTAINVRNRKYMENQGDNLSTKLIGKPGVDASELEGGVGRWTPYMYRGKLSNPVSIANEEIAGSDLYGQELTDKRNSIIRDKASLFDKGSYASNVFENIDKNLERTLPGEYFYLPQEMQPIKITAKKKKKNGGWLEKYK